MDEPRTGTSQQGEHPQHPSAGSQSEVQRTTVQVAAQAADAKAKAASESRAAENEAKIKAAVAAKKHEHVFAYVGEESLVSPLDARCVCGTTHQDVRRAAKA